MITLQSLNDIPIKITLSLITGRPIQFTPPNHTLIDPDDFFFAETVANIISPNSSLTVSKSGTSAIFVPAEISNGDNLSLHLSTRSFRRPLCLQNLILAALFGKRPLELKITADRDILSKSRAIFSPSIFRLNTEFLPLLRHFGAGGVKIETSATKGDLEVSLSVAVVASLRPVNLTAPGEIAKIRGMAFGRLVPAAIPARLVYKAKGVFIRLSPDVWIATERFLDGRSSDGFGDEADGLREGGSAQGYGICLAAESTAGAVLTSEAVYAGEARPEDVADLCSARLLREIGRVEHNFIYCYYMCL